MRDRKATKSKVAATVAAIFALFASLVVFAPPAAAECGSVWSCNTWPYTAPELQSGWIRDQRVVDVNGRLETRTMDYRPPTCETGLGLYVHKDVPIASMYIVVTTPPGIEGQVLPDAPAMVQMDPPPKDGRTYQWLVSVIPYDYTWWEYVHYAWDPLGWYHTGVITCGTAPATPQPAPRADSPYSGVSAADAQATCKSSGKAAKHVQKRLKPKRWACKVLPPACKSAQALKQANKVKAARKSQRRCNKVLRNWLR